MQVASRFAHPRFDEELPGNERNCDRLAYPNLSNAIPIPEEHLGTIFNLEIGENVWWDREKAVILATVEAFCYLGSKPSVILRRKGGVVNRQGTDVSFDGAFDFDLETYRRLNLKRTSPPDDTIVIETSDSVTMVQNYTIPACNIYSPRGNHCRSDQTVAAGEIFKLVRFAKSTGMATHGMTYAVIRDKDGYEFHVPVEWLALRPEQKPPSRNDEISQETGEEANINNEHTDAEKTAEADDEISAEAQLRNKRKLPDDIPLFIKIDLGHTHGWAEAEVTRVKGRWLHYALREEHADKSDQHGGRVQVIGRDIIWRRSAEAAL
jgi:hypothetical protein